MTDGTAPTGAPTAPPPQGKPPLRRPRDGRILGGVCLGIARHLGVDVVLVRIVVVVVTVATGGLGAIGYVLGLVFVDSEDGAGAPATDASDPVRSREPLFYVGIGLLVVGALVLLGGPLDGGLFGLGLRPGVILPLVLLAFGVALWRSGDRRDVPPVPPAAVAAPSPGAPPSAAASPAAARPLETTMQTTPTRPTARPDDTVTGPPTGTLPGGPIGATGAPPAPAVGGSPAGGPAPGGPAPAGTAPSGTAPGGPAPGGGAPPAQPPVAEGGGSFVPPPTPDRERSLLGRLTLGIALLAAGVLWSLDLAGVTQLGLLRVVSVAVLVLGLGLLVGSLVGRARWLAVPALLLAPFVLVGAVLPAGLVQDVVDGRNDGFGELRERPTTVAELDTSYQLGAGAIELDLTQLDAAALEDVDGASVSMQVGAGEIVVVVPDDLGVDVTARTGAGEVVLFGAAGGPPSSGAGLGVTRSASHRPDVDAPTITLDLYVGLGAVEVRLRERDVTPDAEPEPEPGADADLDAGVELDPDATLEPEPGTDSDLDVDLDEEPSAARR